MDMIQTISAGGIVLNREGMVLVVAQRHNAWSLPKGKIDPGEDELTAAEREIYEESGVDHLVMQKKLGQYQRYKLGVNGQDDQGELKTLHFYLFTTDQMELKPIDPHNPEARWVNKGDVPAMLTHPKDREFYESVMGEF
ncbi:MAG: NUDIX domain-containing protein [Candidatus Omnitrophica bacterium]|nr:NUDIX domain-containing protein [Candidatus Omnitrophota bacterium]